MQHTAQFLSSFLNVEVIKHFRFSIFCSGIHTEENGQHFTKLHFKLNTPVFIVSVPSYEQAPATHTRRTICTDHVLVLSHRRRFDWLSNHPPHFRLSSPHSVPSFMSCSRPPRRFLKIYSSISFSPPHIIISNFFSSFFQYNFPYYVHIPYNLSLDVHQSLKFPVLYPQSSVLISCIYNTTLVTVPFTYLNFHASFPVNSLSIFAGSCLSCISSNPRMEIINGL